MKHIRLGTTKNAWRPVYKVVQRVVLFPTSFSPLASTSPHSVVLSSNTSSHSFLAILSEPTAKAITSQMIFQLGLSLHPFHHLSRSTIVAGATHIVPHYLRILVHYTLIGSQCNNMWSSDSIYVLCKICIWLDQHYE